MRVLERPTRLREQDPGAVGVAGLSGRQALLGALHAQLERGPAPEHRQAEGAGDEQAGAGGDERTHP